MLGGVSCVSGRIGERESDVGPHTGHDVARLEEVRWCRLCVVADVAVGRGDGEVRSGDEGDEAGARLRLGRVEAGEGGADAAGTRGHKGAKERGSSSADAAANANANANAAEANAAAAVAPRRRREIGSVLGLARRLQRRAELGKRCGDREQPGVTHVDRLRGGCRRAVSGGGERVADGGGEVRREPAVGVEPLEEELVCEAAHQPQAVLGRV